MEPKLGIEPRPHPYQGCTLPLSYFGLVADSGDAPDSEAYEASLVTGPTASFWSENVVLPHGTQDISLVLYC